MARSKSKHIRLIMRRRKQWKQRMKRRKEEIKANGGKPLPRKVTPRKPLLPPPAPAPQPAAAPPATPQA
jgi:hypothetical protein